MGTLTSYLLDTCTFIWLCSEPARLSAPVVSILRSADASPVLSDITILEISLKWSAGKITLPGPPRHWIETQATAWSLPFRPIGREDIYRATELPDHHRDPFDRLLVAAAINANATILTPDEAVQRYPVSWAW